MKMFTKNLLNMYRTHNNIHGQCARGKVFYDKRFDLAWKIAKEQDISQAAQNRLRWIDHHAKNSNAVLTCRYFEISESCFWKWKNRYETMRLKGLEDIDLENQKNQKIKNTI